VLNAHSAVGGKVEGGQGRTGAVLVAPIFRGAWGDSEGYHVGRSVDVCVSVPSKVAANPINSVEVKGISARGG
jgi:hypothetical protein